MVQATSKCKLAEFYNYINGNMMLAAVVAFSDTEPLKYMYSAMFAGALSFALLLVLTWTLNLVGLLPCAAPAPLPAFEHAAATSFQTNVWYILERNLHEHELAEQRRLLSNARKAALSNVTDPSLRLCIYRMISTLYGLRRAALYEPLSEVAVVNLWEPMQMELGKLVNRVTAILKHEVEVEDIPDLKAAARSLAMLIVYINSMDIPAVMVELFLVASVGKFFAQDPRVGYFGYQTVTTFSIVGVCNALDSELDGDARIALAWLRMLFTMTGLFTAIFLSLVSSPSFCGRRLALQTSKELVCMSNAVSALVEGIISREPDGFTFPEHGLPTMVEMGLTLLNEDNARSAEKPWFREEAVYLQLIHASSTRCSVPAKCLSAAQDDVARLSRSTVVVEEVFRSCYRTMSPAADRLLLDPIRPLLDDVARHLQRSAQELDRTLRSIVDPEFAVRWAEETLESMLYLYATFDENRTKLLFKRTWAAEGEVTDSTHMIQVMSSGGVGLHEAIHAINTFIEDWVTVVNKLLGCQLSIPNSAVEASISSLEMFETKAVSDGNGIPRIRAGTCAY
ncbi:hypothetical protein FOL47_010451 [Perkinsus chesapeaki]|uniref:Aluminum-activated malate transporter 1 n=1 Tax=Perkinsus chesapeaki TaxID=330153 RepID=A0A7J6MPL8_PERCH|nr:hypothetical protein FOL47_010451 [Perkinsus chesapeaki]